MIHRKSIRELEKMRQANQIVGETLLEMKEKAKPGVSTWELDLVARAACKRHKVEPAFLNYSGYPAALCASINEEVVHGIPSRKRILKEGDIISMDFGVRKDGWNGDAAITVAVGEISQQARRLMQVTRESLMKAIEMVKPGNHLRDIGGAVQDHVEAAGFSVVRDFVGHGIGKKMHEEPQIPNYRPSGVGWNPELKPGMTLAIEPMVNVGSYEVLVLEDDWTAVTKDGSLSAHFEHTVAIVDGGCEILSYVEGL